VGTNKLYAFNVARRQRIQQYTVIGWLAEFCCGDIVQFVRILQMIVRRDGNAVLPDCSDVAGVTVCCLSDSGVRLFRLAAISFLALFLTLPEN
jgi:hypothetical protein